MSRPPILTPRKTVGHRTPRIDALERVTGKATYTGDIHLPGVKLVLTHENCQLVWGAGSVAGGRHYVDEVKKNTRQRRYVFNNPVRFYGEPVAAVAATNRHIAEEAMRLISV